MPERTKRRRSASGEGQGLGRCLLWSLILLLVAALFLKFHLIPAKERLWRIRRHFQEMSEEATELDREHRELQAEREAILEDPMYQERLMRRNFRRGSSDGEVEVYLKERP
jgi:type II secretory pathway component PulM